MVRKRYWEKITAAMFIAAVCASFATVGAIFLTGCSSAKQAIGSSAQSVNVQAANSKRSATQIIELAQATQALESVKADSVAMEAQGQIVTLGSSIIAEQDQILVGAFDEQPGYCRYRHRGNRTPVANWPGNADQARGVVVGHVYPQGYDAVSRSRPENAR